MARPGNLVTSRQTARDGSLGAFVRWLRGSFAGTGFETNDLSEREMRRIRAKQIDAITRLVPLTMTINLANVAIILFVFWNTGSNLFLGYLGADNRRCGGAWRRGRGYGRAAAHRKKHRATP